MTHGGGERTLGDVRGARAARIAAKLVIVLTSCAADPMPPAPGQPAFDWVGVPSQVRVGQSVSYVLPDGGILKAIEP